jgi:outer membrane protein OmpA-like peptidoglycan-associated protein
MMNKRILTGTIGMLCLCAWSSCRVPKTKTAYMRKTYKTLKRSLKGVNVSSAHDTVTASFPFNLMFGFNSSSIEASSKPILSRLANILNKYDKTAVLINGYTDSVGTDEYNDRLSTQRADTTKAAMLQFGVLPERLKTWGRGESNPVAPNETEEGRALNRRVEFVILYKEGK